MKKIFKYFIAIVTLFTFITKVNAAGATISVNTSASQIIVGNNITVTVTISSSSPLGSWEYNLNYDKNIFSLVSSDVGLHYAGVVQNNSTKAVSYRYTFKANRSGNASFYIDASTVFGFDESIFEVTNGKRNVRAITYSEYQASLSSNNNLKDIKVEGYEISPVFNKDTLEYVVSVPSDVTKITINGSVEDNTASATGLGEFEVSEGENKFEIKVTAQNGSTKTYTVKVNVEDKNPIEVVIDNEKYTVVKRGSTLVSPSTYEEVKETINGIEVPAFKSSITNYVLVGLKNSSGEAKLYVFDKMNDTYTLYREIKTSGITLFPKESKKELKGFVKETITLNEEKINAYRYKNSKDFYVVYGVNIENNVEGFYQLDTTNNSFVKYDIPANSFK